MDPDCIDWLNGENDDEYGQENRTKGKIRIMIKHRTEFIRIAKTHNPQNLVGKAALSWVSKNLDEVSDDIIRRIPEQRMGRADLRNYCRDTGNPVEACFLTVMAWGGMRTDHLRRMWSAREKWSPALNQLRDASALSRKQCFNLLWQLRRDGCLPGARAAFFTKLIFFLREKNDGYIMDQWTAKSINLIEGRDVVPIDGLGMVDDSVCDEHYEDFCKCVEGIAGEINQSPDKTEEILMSKGGVKPEAWRAYVKTHYT